MKKFLLWLQIRSLEITADNRALVSNYIKDPVVASDMKMRQANLLVEITRLKAEYRKMTRGGGLQSWRSA